VRQLNFLDCSHLAALLLQKLSESSARAGQMKSPADTRGFTSAELHLLRGGERKKKLIFYFIQRLAIFYLIDRFRLWQIEKRWLCSVTTTTVACGE
jgi:hypothetical protein